MNSMLVHLQRYTHISMLKNYNLKNPYRFAEADKYIKQRNYNKVSTYAEFVHSAQMQNNMIVINEGQWQQYKKTISKDFKELDWVYQRLFPITQKGDYEHFEDYRNKTLVSFTKQCFQKRQYHHKFYLSLFLIVPIQIYLFLFYYNPFIKGDKQTVVVADPQKFETFQPTVCVDNITQLQNRMKIFAAAALTGDYETRIKSKDAHIFGI